MEMLDVVVVGRWMLDIGLLFGWIRTHGHGIVVWSDLLSSAIYEHGMDNGV